MLKKPKGYIVKIRESRTFKGIALCLALNLLAEIIQPTVSLALTEGPSQPEVQSFEPVGTTQMVDLFTGDFNYNIPLFNLPGPNGGYPVNLAYHAGISPDDEASWVGLGWNINVGSLVRNMRGLPDEFNSKRRDKNEAHAHGDHLLVKSDMKQSWTLGASANYSTEIAGGELASFSLGGSVYYNNYKGLGTGLNLGFGIAKNEKYSLGLSLDSENGLGLSATISHEARADNTKNSYALGVNFDGGLSCDFSLGRSGKGKSSNTKTKAKTTKASVGTSVGYSFASSAFIPAVRNKMTKYNLSANISFGSTATPTAFEYGFGVFYNTEDLNNIDKNGRYVRVAGYEKMGDVEVDKEYVTHDFMRQSDGQVTRASVALANSYYTHDTYMSTGQGSVSSFRAKRNDIGKSFDPKVRNVSGGIHLGLELEVGSGTHTGVDLGVNFGWDTQGPWDNTNGNTNLLDFYAKPSLGNGVTENLFYKAHGEPTIGELNEYEFLSNLELAEVKLRDKDAETKASGHRQVNEGAVGFDNDGHSPEHRFVRNTVIHDFKNYEVENLGEFDIRYYTGVDFGHDPAEKLNRTVKEGVDISGHKAGFKVLNDQGQYYTYALPAYNRVETENIFSVREHDANQLVEYSMKNGEVDYKLKNEPLNIRNKSHKAINKTTKSPYAHSYLLTSVQGADYVDVTNNGPSDDDLGYWVKFDYTCPETNYMWRAPYDERKVQYSPGASYHSGDDKGSYEYGEKEIWYLGRIETKTHIAVFELINDREDNKEADAEYVDDTDSNPNHDEDHGLRLNSIKVYEKSAYRTEGTPLQTIQFTHEYELCEGTPNSDAQGAKKLTLKSIEFTSLGSKRGEQSRYSFEYSNNYAYNPIGYDSWGGYKEVSSDADFNIHFPYTKQFDQQNSKWGDAFNQNNYAAAWCLTKINLPSGGAIDIAYESDDYGYVQHKTASQMFRIARVNGYSGTQDDELYETGQDEFFNDQSNQDEKRRRIYFVLEEPITETDELDQAKEVYNRYVKPLIQDEKGNRNLYFKSRIRLTKTPSVWDYVSGYLPLEKELSVYQGGEMMYHYGVDGDYGFVTVQPAKKANGSIIDNYHPMSVAAWTYLQTDAQELLNNPNSFESDEANEDNFLGKAVDIVNIIPTLSSSFGAIKSYCASKRMAQFIDLEKSCIRLASPDKKKYGGGHRVSDISITDNWTADNNAGTPDDRSATYGQHYDYTMEEEIEGGDVLTISSGVAQYEPQLGGDENALKYPIHYYGKTSTFSKNNLFTEMPTNEHLFPGASVGYRKVTVTSRATHDQLGNNTNKRTGGATVHEFFTAKEFPTMVSMTQVHEAENTQGVFNLPITIPFIGSVNRQHYYGTQAYLIETNDMHGRPKSVKTFEINTTGIDYKINTQPITESVYEYQSKPIVYQGESVRKLDNEVDIIPNDGSYEIAGSKKQMGVEVDLFTDQRNYNTFNHGVSAAINLDLPSTITPPFPSVWPNVTTSETVFRTYVTNKVVHRSGILKKTISRDLQTSNESEVIAYDERSGVPMLTKVKNEFGDDFYNYNIPAYYAYDQMGHAYRNINFNFNAGVVSLEPNSGEHGGVYLKFTSQNSGLEHLTRGDELLIEGAYIAGTEELRNSEVGAGMLPDSYRKGYFLGFEYNANGRRYGIVHMLEDLDVDDFGPVFHDDDDNVVTVENIEDLYFKMRVIRSGRRNHYSASGASYSTKGEMKFVMEGGSLTDREKLTLTTLNSGDASNTTLKTDKIVGNSVLSATASLYKDDWSSISENSAQTELDNPYLAGSSGIWRPYKSYTYVGPRKSVQSMNNTNDNPDLRMDGLFVDEIPLFSWDIGDFEDYVSNWEWVNEVTRFSEDSYEIENRNRLGIYSSALYGYDNSLTIAVGGNASYFEMGAIDFEKAKLDKFGDWAFGKSMKQTNMNFHTASVGVSSVLRSEVLDIEMAHFDGTNLVLKTKTLFDDFQNLQYLNTIGLTINQIKTHGHQGNVGMHINGDVSTVTSYINPVDNQSYAQITVVPSVDNSDLPGVKDLPFNTYYKGKVRMLITRSVESGFSAEGKVAIASNKAHTGKQSLKILTDIAFEQPMLKMIKNKKYVLSMWVSKDDTDDHDYNLSDIVKVGSLSGGMFIELPSSKVVSNVIEGWQKIDVEFYSSENVPSVTIQFTPEVGGIYIDDVRFSPKVGGVTTYVYDPVTMWLRASLNVDNYATLFFYDEEGNLTLKKQETEEGIFTISESRGHVAE